MILYTIGFTKSSAEDFFDRLKKSNVTKLVDVRLNNVSQLAGFAKRDDLQYFLRRICQIPYRHETDLAPTAALLDEHKKKKGAWNLYEKKFLNLIQKRKIEDKFSPSQFDGACLLCSEHEPHHCHRRLVAEYLQKHWPDLEIRHL